ncbi:hypothetical protein PsYK624_008130 [Phanerochaete sordida]|uniref:Uncharacterized protein n=1 Tax=Phanerochaete sordida TaxID=48140 RepID=A0A9P3FYB3_9APHY|nr:hypothetical protein PsYK624_008130 [Phanerochaete sordida]
MGRQTQLLHNRSLIPRPGYVVIKRESLMKCMGLKEKDRTRFEQAKFLLRKLCPKYLKVGRSYSEQTDTNWRKFCEAACEAEPMFRRYVDYWPITHYIQGYLYALKARQRERRNRRASSSEDDDEEDEEYEAESTGFCEPVKGLAASQHKVVGDRTLPKSATHILQRMFDFRAVLKEADPILGTHYERLASAGINDKQSLEAFCDFPKRFEYG